MNINNIKTKILVASRHGRLAQCLLRGKRLQSMGIFACLESRIRSDGKSKMEIISRINHPLTKNALSLPPTTLISTSENI